MIDGAFFPLRLTPEGGARKLISNMITDGYKILRHGKTLNFYGTDIADNFFLVSGAMPAAAEPKSRHI
jgi:hypothetical protein